MAAIRLIPITDGINIRADISGMAEGDVSTVKLEPLSVRSETAASCVKPVPVVCSTVWYMID